MARTCHTNECLLKGVFRAFEALRQLMDENSVSDPASPCGIMAGTVRDLILRNPSMRHQKADCRPNVFETRVKLWDMFIHPNVYQEKQKAFGKVFGNAKAPPCPVSGAVESFRQAVSLLLGITGPWAGDEGNHDMISARMYNLAITRYLNLIFSTARKVQESSLDAFRGGKGTGSSFRIYARKTVWRVLGMAVDQAVYISSQCTMRNQISAPQLMTSCRTQLILLTSKRRRSQSRRRGHKTFSLHRHRQRFSRLSMSSSGLFV